MFVVTLTYTAPAERVDAVRAEHRDWLDQHVASGLLLVAGPQVPRTGGVFIVSSKLDREALTVVLKEDPFHIHGVADFAIVEFEATKVNPALADLV